MNDVMPKRRIDRVASLFVVLSALAMALMAFVIVKPNRIAAGEPKTLFNLLDQPIIWLLLILWLVWAGISLFQPKPLWRLMSANAVLLALIVALGLVATHFAVKPAVRVTSGGAFWSLFAIFALSATDALIRFQLRAWQRLAVLAAYVALGAIIFLSGLLDHLAIMIEYGQRQTQFWAEGQRHLALTFGAVAIALLIGLPLGIACFQIPKIRNFVLQSLSLIQTIPSIALFGLLMAPLGWLAANTSWAAALGIRGIGAAPALIALVIYSLLPIVANTVAGLNNVAPAVRDAAKGMGMTRLQTLMQIELPLAFPVILTGIRIVLVQAIGLVTVAALVGGGGFGAFVFQGIGQTATDLVLLGALPTVFLAFVAAIILDALTESVTKV